MQFEVPQFIEIEDKIFGPFTLKQFVYLAGGAGLSFVIFKFLPSFLAILFIIPIAGLSLALSFYKINNRPFIDIVESFFNYIINEKLYVWRKKDKKINPSEKKEEDVISQLYVPKLSGSKLKDLSWSLDVQEHSSVINKK